MPSRTGLRGKLVFSLVICANEQDYYRLVGIVVGTGKKRDVSGKETIWYLIADFTEEKCGSGG